MLVETTLQRKMHSHLAGVQVTADKIAMQKFNTVLFSLDLCNKYSPNFYSRLVLLA